MMKDCEFAGKTVQELKEYAAKGEAYAMYSLGLHYGSLSEDENDENLSEEAATAIAVEWLIKAAELGVTKAETHLEDYKKSGNKAIKERIQRIFKELRRHPRTGIGKPEKLKHDSLKRWSRNIDKKNRILYIINEIEVIVHISSAKGHYDDH